MTKKDFYKYIILAGAENHGDLIASVKQVVAEFENISDFAKQTLHADDIIGVVNKSFDLLILLANMDLNHPTIKAMSEKQREGSEGVMVAYMQCLALLAIDKIHAAKFILDDDIESLTKSSTKVKELKKSLKSLITDSTAIKGEKEEFVLDLIDTRDEDELLKYATLNLHGHLKQDTDPFVCLILSAIISTNSADIALDKTLNARRH